MGWEDYDLLIHRAGTVLCEPGWAWDSPVMLDFDLWYIWSGRGTLSVQGQRIPISAGSCFCLQPGKKYSGQHDPAHRLGVCFLHFDFITATGKVAELAPADRPPLLALVDDADFIERLLKQAVRLHESREPFAGAEAAVYLRGALLDLARSAARPPVDPVQQQHRDAIRSIARQIRENPGELFSIEALAEQAGYSADHFSRLFRQIVGLTPKEFCIRTRLQRAQTLLRESTHNIEQIAQTLGYADVFFFSRQFKQRIGQSPTRWRATAASNPTLADRERIG